MLAAVQGLHGGQLVVRELEQLVQTHPPEDRLDGRRAEHRTSWRPAALSTRSRTIRLQIVADGRISTCEKSTITS